jgi:hypothetical protein
VLRLRKLGAITAIRAIIAVAGGAALLAAAVVARRLR